MGDVVAGGFHVAGGVVGEGWYGAGGLALALLSHPEEWGWGTAVV